MRYLIKKNQIPINMNKKLKIKIALVLGTRPEIIRLSEVIKKLKKNVNLILIHTNQNYDYSTLCFLIMYVYMFFKVCSRR